MSKRAIFVYDGKVEFCDERYYKFINTETGEELYYPSATFILRSFPMDFELLKWVGNVGNESAKRISSQAAESGSKVHNAIEKLLLDEKIKWDDKIYNEQEWSGICRFLDFYATYQPKLIFSERTIFSHKHKYAGTIDYLCKIGDETWLIDFKFSNAVHDSYMLQLAAYRNAIQEELNIKVDKMAILHLKAQNKKGWKLEEPKEDYQKLFDIFKKTQVLFLFTNPNCKPKNLVLPEEISLKEIEL